MGKQQILLSFAAMVSGLYLLLGFSCAKGQDKPIPSADDPKLLASSPFSECPPLPDQIQEGTIAVYVAKMPKKPGFVCARAVNGIRHSVSFNSFLLQKREEGQFHDFTEPLPPTPPGVIIGEEPIRLEMVIGSRFDRQFPSFSPAPPGTYRTCFRYTLHHMITERQEVCSEEFTLP